MDKIYRVAAVVVTYNRKELLQECLRALLRQRTDGTRRGGDEAVLDILLVDNASTDGTHDAVLPLLEQNPGISYLPLKENLGGAGGFHYGMKRAFCEGYDYIWIMDDDTIPEPDALDTLLQGVQYLCDYSQLDGAAMPGYVSSKVLWTDRTPCRMNEQRRTGRTVVMPWRREGGDRDCLAEQIDQATFVSLMFPRDIIKEMGLPLKEYFIWGDDKEYTLRVARRYPCYLISESVVIHKMDRNTGSNITYDKVERISRYFYAYRNDLATAKRQGIRAVCVYLMAFVLNMLRVVLHSPDHKRERIAVMWKGLSAGIGFAPEVEYAD